MAFQLRALASPLNLEPGPNECSPLQLGPFLEAQFKDWPLVMCNLIFSNLGQEVF